MLVLVLVLLMAGGCRASDDEKKRVQERKDDSVMMTRNSCPSSRCSNCVLEMGLTPFDLKTSEAAPKLETFSSEAAAVVASVIVAESAGDSHVLLSADQRMKRRRKMMIAVPVYQASSQIPLIACDTIYVSSMNASCSLLRIEC